MIGSGSLQGFRAHLTLGLILAASAAPLASGQPALQRFAKNDGSGTAWAVRAPDGPLLFTDQIAAANLQQDARAQADEALDRLAALLAPAGGDLQHLIRLNVYAPDAAAISAAQAAIAARFAAAPPAVTILWVQPQTLSAQVAFEAIAALPAGSATVKILSPDTAILPAGGKVFVSGQAEKAADLPTAARLTMASLRRSLADLGLSASDIVQIKAYLQPFAGCAAARAEIEKSFGADPVPPIVLIPWQSDLPTEIELVAAAPRLGIPTTSSPPVQPHPLAGVAEAPKAFVPLPASPSERLTFPALPHLANNSRFSRVAAVAAGTPLIFIGELGGARPPGALATPSAPRAQWTPIFAHLGSILYDAGSSFRQLVKATYYLAGPESRAALSEIRDVYFDPTRAPAASAVQISNPDFPSAPTSIPAALDFIAVPTH